jgi:hypothetical protein
VIALPPLLAGAVKATDACALPGVATGEVGAPGTVAGVTALEVSEGAPVPTAFVAVTVNLYEVPLVRPVTVIGVVAPVPVKLPGCEVTVYEVIGLPPLLPGAAKETEACALPPVAVAAVGASGTVAGVTAEEAEEAEPVPTLLVAVTVKVYDVPLVRPETTIGEVAPVPVKPPGLEVTV